MRINEPSPTPRFDGGTFGFLTLGVGSFFSTQCYHTSLLLIAGPLRVQIDLPSPYCKILADATRKADLGITPADIDHFICTHVHGDHSNGCEDVGYYKLFVQGKRATLYVLPEVAKTLWENKLFASMGPLTDEQLNPLAPATLETFFDVRLVTPETPTMIGDVAMRIRRTRHSVPCFAMKFERRGRRLGYSSDTIFDRELIDWLGECDLIFHETTPAGPHTKYKDLTTLPAALKDKMVLIHMSDGLKCDDPHFRLAAQGAFYQIND